MSNQQKRLLGPKVVSGIVDLYKQQLIDKLREKIIINPVTEKPTTDRLGMVHNNTIQDIIKELDEQISR